MALKTLVKLSAVSNLSDARYAAGMGVEMMGFCMDYKSDKRLELDKFKEIIGWVSGVKIVGEMGNNSLTQIQQAIEEYYCDVIETENKNELQAIMALGLPVIFNGASEETQYQLIDIEEFKSNKSYSAPILLSGDIKLDQLDQLLSQPSVVGIAMQGGEEIRPGFKNFDELADILEALEVDEPY